MEIPETMVCRMPVFTLWAPSVCLHSEAGEIADTVASLLMFLEPEHIVVARIDFVGTPFASTSKARARF